MRFWMRTSTSRFRVRRSEIGPFVILLTLLHSSLRLPAAHNYDSLGAGDNDSTTVRQGRSQEDRARRDAGARAAAGLFARRHRRDATGSPAPRPRRAPRSAICAACRGRRSTTTIRAISTSSRSRNPRRDGAVRILVAIADVDALVKKDSAIDGHAWTNTTSVYTPAGIFPMLPEKLSTDLTSLGEGEERLAIVIEMAIAADGAVTRFGHLPRGRAQSRQARLQRRRRVARGHGAGAAQGSRPFPDWTSSCASRTGVAQALRRAAHARRRAAASKRSRCGRCSTTATLADLRPDAEEPREGADRGLHDRGQRRHRAIPRAEEACRRCAACCGPQALGPDRRAGGGVGDAAAAAARRRGARCVPRRAARRPIRTRFPDLSLVGRQAAGLGRVRARDSGAAGGGTLRPGGQRLHAFDGAESPLSRPRHAAPAEGGARGATVALLQRRARGAGAPLHRAGGQRGQGRAAGREVGRRDAARVADRRALRRAS